MGPTTMYTTLTIHYVSTPMSPTNQHPPHTPQNTTHTHLLGNPRCSAQQLVLLLLDTSSSPALQILATLGHCTHHPSGLCGLPASLSCKFLGHPCHFIKQEIPVSFLAFGFWPRWLHSNLRGEEGDVGRRMCGIARECVGWTENVWGLLLDKIVQQLYIMVARKSMHTPIPLDCWVVALVVVAAQLQNHPPCPSPTPHPTPCWRWGTCVQTLEQTLGHASSVQRGVHRGLAVPVHGPAPCRDHGLAPVRCWVGALIPWRMRAAACQTTARGAAARRCLVAVCVWSVMMDQPSAAPRQPPATPYG